MSPWNLPPAPGKVRETGWIIVVTGNESGKPVEVNVGRCAARVKSSFVTGDNPSSKRRCLGSHWIAMNHRVNRVNQGRRSAEAVGDADKAGVEFPHDDERENEGAHILTTRGSLPPNWATN